MLLARFWLVVFLIFVVAGCVEKSSGELVASSEGAATDVPPKEATTDLQAASDAKDAVDTRLGNALGRVGGLLTPPESAAFAKAFNALPDVVQAHNDYLTKSATLADALGQVAADPAQIQSYGASNLLAGYALLATTPQAASALQFGTDVLAHKIVLPGVADNDVLEKVVGASLAGAYLQNLLQTGDVPSATATTVAVLSKGSSVTLNIAGWLQRYNAFQQVDVIDNAIGVSSQSTIAGLRTIAGIIAIWTIGDDLYDGDPQAAVTAFLQSGGNAINGIAAATSLFRRVCMGIDNTPLADTVIKYAGKIATGIGLVMNAIALWNDAGNWNDSAAAKVQVAADVIAIAASIAVLVSTGPVGPILATVSLGLGFFVDWLDARAAAEQEVADITSCLPQAGLDDGLVQAIENADPNMVADLAKNAALTPETAQWFITVDPDLVNAATEDGVSFLGLQITEKIFTLDADKTTALLKAVVGDATGADATARLDLFVRGTDFGGGWTGDLAPSDALDWLTTAETDGDADQAANRTAAFTAAHDYLAGLQ